MTTEEEVGVKRSQVKGCLELPEARGRGHRPRRVWSCQRPEEAKKGWFLETSERAQPCQNLDSRFLALKL